MLRSSQANGEICAETLVRLARPGIARLAVEGDKAVVYHCADNSRVYRAQELSPLEFDSDDAPTIEALFQVRRCEEQISQLWREALCF